MSTINFVNTTPEDLVELLSKSVKAEIQQQLKDLNSDPTLSEYLTPDETAELLKVTKPTIWRYRKRGKLTPYYFENKVYYKRSEIEQGFTKMKK